MKITKLRIQNYKNIQDLTIDFADGLNYAAFVGLNGSGKSNIIEAVSLSFLYLYKYENNQKKPLNLLDSNFDFQITINIGGDDYSLTKENYQKLPTGVIACYSGEDSRLYNDIFQKSYQEYFHNIAQSRGKELHQNINLIATPPKMLYIDKSCWEICIITMLCSDNDRVRKFIKKVFGEIDLAKVGFSFGLNSLPNSRNSIVRFVKRIDDEQREPNNNGYVSINYVSMLDIDGYPLTVKDIFHYLFMSVVPKEVEGANKLIKDLQLHGLDIKSLSEGEKKQILITFINEILADENSLVLLDEPDAHWHIERQKGLANTFTKQKHFTILTTHSPTLTGVLDENAIYMLDNTESGLLNLVSRNKIATLALIGADLTIPEKNVLLSSLNSCFLFVEGKHDKEHIITAWRFHKQHYPNLNFKIFVLHGEKNIAPFLKKFLLCDDFDHSKKIYIAIYDNDTAGQEAINKDGYQTRNEKPYKPLIKEQNKSNYSNCFAILLPKKDDYNHGFTIENMYPSDRYKQAFQDAFNKQSSFNDSINNISDNIKENAKTNLVKNSKSFEEKDFEYFGELFYLIDEIVNLNNNTPPNNTQVSTPSQVRSTQIINNISSLPATVVNKQVNIFADYAPRGQNRVHYVATFNKFTKEVIYNGNTYPTANQAMVFIRKEANSKKNVGGVQAGVFWKYLDEDGKPRPLSDFLK